MRRLIIFFGTVLFFEHSAFSQSAATYHVFPQFADGTLPDGTNYQSVLLATNASSDSAVCRIRIYGPTTSRIQGGDTFTLPGLGSFFIAPSFGNLFSLASGYATLSCDRPVTAVLGYLYAAGSDLRSGAAVFSSPPLTRAQLIVDVRPGSRTGIAIANDTDANTQYMLIAKNPAGVVVASATLPVPARSNVARFADELLALPTGFLGAVEVTSPGGAPFSIIGLNFLGAIFITQPATALP
jgi:hypothetical protein